MQKIKERTQKEILNRYHERKGDDLFGFEVDEYLPYLDFEHAKQFLKDDCTQEIWDGIKNHNSPSIGARTELEDYLEFAWDKANNCRGLSASRSIGHIIAWLWLMADDEFYKKFANSDYEDYGKPQLVLVCDYLEIDWRQYAEDEQ